MNGVVICSSCVMSGLSCWSVVGSEIVESNVFSTSAVVVLGFLRAGIMVNLALRGSMMWAGRIKFCCRPCTLKVMGPDQSRLILGWGHRRVSMALILGVNPLWMASIS